MTDHTPGPWSEIRIGRNGDGRPRSGECQIVNAAGVGVAIVTHDGSPEAAANITLMARAPELLAELADSRARRDALDAVSCACLERAVKAEREVKRLGAKQIVRIVIEDGRVFDAAGNELCSAEVKGG